MTTAEQGEEPVALCWHCGDAIYAGEPKREYAADMIACGGCAARNDEWAEAVLGISPHDGDSAGVVG